MGGRSADVPTIATAMTAGRSVRSLPDAGVAILQDGVKMVSPALADAEVIGTSMVVPGFEGGR